MPIKINPSEAFYVLLDNAATGTSSDYVFRAEYLNHQIQLVNAGTTAQNFVVYTSNDGNNWVAIRDQTDVDATVQAYSGASAGGVIQLSGSYPWIKIITGTANAGPLSATIYSNNWRSS